MKRVSLVVLALLICGFTAMAQEYPKSELFLGYEYIRFVPALAGNPSVNMNGGGGAISYNFSHMFGLKAEFTGAGFGDFTQSSSTGLNTITRSGNFFTYMFGPQVTFRQHPKVQPFVHLLFGGAYSNFYGNVQQAGVITTSPMVQDAGKHAFAMAFGGGLDVNVAKSVAIRLGQFDYFMTRFSGRELQTSGTGSLGPLEISNQSNFRYLIGIKFNIGNTK